MMANDNNPDRKPRSVALDTLVILLAVGALAWIVIVTVILALAG